VCVAKYWDDLWLGVKGQSNLDIAGFPRNIFRYSVKSKFYLLNKQLKYWGRALVVLGGAKLLPTTKKLRIQYEELLAVRLWALRSMVKRETALIER